MEFLVTQFGMMAIIVIGMIGVFYPRTIQAIEVKVSEALTFGIPNPFVSFLETDRYLRVVRLFGCVSLLIACAAEYALYLRA
jgi:hypothetical protein